jgi:hypothetical protein
MVKSGIKPNTFVSLVGVILLAGLLVGFIVSRVMGMKSMTSSSAQNAPSVKSTNNEVGLTDTTAFTDTAEGQLQDGGISGEGTHHLVRAGGDSQNVYLTSTVIDLSSFVGKKVQVWGQTVAGKKAGWLMDVGKIKIVE